MTLHKRRIPMTALLACTVAIAGCVDPEGLARAPLAKKADVRCAKSSAQVKALGSPDLSRLPAAGRYFNKRREISLNLRTQLSDLDPNKKVEPEWLKTLAIYDKTRNDFGEIASAVTNKDAFSARTLARVAAKDGKAASRAFGQLGAPRCGSVSITNLSGGAATLSR